MSFGLLNVAAAAAAAVEVDVVRTERVGCEVVVVVVVVERGRRGRRRRGRTFEHLLTIEHVVDVQRRLLLLLLLLCARDGRRRHHNAVEIIVVIVMIELYGMVLMLIGMKVRLAADEHALMSDVARLAQRGLALVAKADRVVLLHAARALLARRRHRVALGNNRSVAVAAVVAHEEVGGAQARQVVQHRVGRVGRGRRRR